MIKCPDSFTGKSGVKSKKLEANLEGAILLVIFEFYYDTRLIINCK